MMQIKWLAHTQVRFSSLILIFSLLTSLSSFAEDVEIDLITKHMENALHADLEKQKNYVNINGPTSIAQQMELKHATLEKADMPE